MMMMRSNKGIKNEGSIIMLHKGGGVIILENGGDCGITANKDNEDLDECP